MKDFAESHSVFFLRSSLSKFGKNVKWSLAAVRSIPSTIHRVHSAFCENATRIVDRKGGSLGFLPLFRRLVRWVRVKKLEFQLWDSERFEKYCERIRCFNLVELEKASRRRLEQELSRLKNENRDFLSTLTPNLRTK
jgi:hypothetical protein